MILLHMSTSQLTGRGGGDGVRWGLHPMVLGDRRLVGRGGG